MEDHMCCWGGNSVGNGVVQFVLIIKIQSSLGDFPSIVKCPPTTYEAGLEMSVSEFIFFLKDTLIVLVLEDGSLRTDLRNQTFDVNDSCQGIKWSDDLYKSRCDSLVIVKSVLSFFKNGI